MARLTATAQFNQYLEGTGYTVDRAGMYFRLWRGEVSIIGTRSTAQMAEYLMSMGLSCELPLVEPQEIEEDIHTQNIEAGFCYQTMPSGVVHVYDPQGNCHIATDIDTADECIRDGVWNCGQQCPIEIHYSPVDDCGHQHIVITELMIPVLEADEDGIVYAPAYLTESEYDYTKHLMEF